MAKETLRLTSLFFIVSFVTKISTSYAQPSLTEYLLATLGSQGTSIPQNNPSRPPLSFQNPSYGPSYQNYQNPPIYTNPPKPSPPISGPLPSPLTAIANLAAAIPVDGCAQPSLTEYLLASLGSQGTPIPPTNPSRLPLSFQNSGYGPSYQNYQNPPIYTSPPKPSPSISGPLPSPLTAIANLAAAIPVADSKSKIPTVPKASEIPSAMLDSNVLNNLAIALQLLIVSNILNTPPAENSCQTKFDFSKFQSASKIETVPISPLTLSYPLKSPVQSLPYMESPARSLCAYESPNLQNSKFIGSSGFIEPSMFGSALTSVNPRASPRSSMTLMSPYEALGPNSPFSDSVLSSLYGSSYSKKDFQSPYASILAADGQKDLFSVADFY